MLWLEIAKETLAGDTHLLRGRRVTKNNLLLEEVIDMFRIFITSIVSLFAVYISGCAYDEDEIQEEITANLVQVTPPNGSELGVNDSIILTFDNIPTGVTSTVGLVTVSGKTALISVPFELGSLVNLTVRWVDGSKELNFHFPGL
jgi:hypothetical protein